MCQGINESPDMFYKRITAQINKAGYAAGVMPVIAKQIFMKGLNRSIALKMGDQPRMNLVESVALATRIWQNAQPKLNQEVTLFPQQIEEERRLQKIIKTREPAYDNHRNPQLKTRFNSERDYENELDNLTKKFQTLQ